MSSVASGHTHYWQQHLEVKYPGLELSLIPAIASGALLYITVGFHCRWYGHSSCAHTKSMTYYYGSTQEWASSDDIIVHHGQEEINNYFIYIKFSSSFQINIDGIGITICFLVSWAERQLVSTDAEAYVCLLPTPWGCSLLLSGSVGCHVLALCPLLPHSVHAGSW